MSLNVVLDSPVRSKLPLMHKDTPGSDSPVLGLMAHTTMPHRIFFWLQIFNKKLHLFHESESLCVFYLSFLLNIGSSLKQHISTLTSPPPLHILPSLLSSATPPQPLYIFFRKENIIQRCQPNKTKEDTIRQGKSHPIKTGKEIQYNFLSVRMKAVWLRNI